MSEFTLFTNTYTYQILFYIVLGIAIYFPYLVNRFTSISLLIIRLSGASSLLIFVLLTLMRINSEIRDFDLLVGVSIELIQMGSLFYFLGAMWPSEKAKNRENS